MSSSSVTSRLGTWSFRSAAHRESIGVVATKRKDAMSANTPLSISVIIEITPPDIPTPPMVTIISLSKNGLNRPTAMTRGSTMRSL